MKKIYLCFLSIIYLMVLNPATSHAQSILDRVKQKIKQRTDAKIDKTINDGLDEAEGKKTKEKKEKEEKNGDVKVKNKDNKNKDNKDEEGKDEEGKVKIKGDKTDNTAELSYTAKFDFVPGEKIIAYDDFSNTNLGDFPANWNTNSGADLVNVDGKPGKWLSLNKEGLFMPDYITKLPENFTFEFEIICNPEFSFYSSAFDVNFGALKNPAKDFQLWKRFKHAEDGIKVSIHPTNAGFAAGTAEFFVYSKNEEVMKNQVGNSQFFSRKSNDAKVSIWRQKQRLRVYLNEDKVLDVPRAFDASVNYNSIVFGTVGGFHHASDRYLIGNIRLAVGEPDTRNKLLNEGKFVTHGILFDVNSDKIKPESYGIIKEIANVLKENEAVKIKIVGHTDSDGDNTKNMELSKKRAESVKNALATEFEISSARLEIDGKGESVPVGKNDTPEGKAQNRRVEFIKM